MTGNRNFSSFGRFAHLAGVSAIALMTAIGSVAPAWATIDNTVVVTGSSPSGTDDVTDSATESVDVIDAISTVTIAKSAADSTDGGAPGLGDVGDEITYTYTMENTGNTTLTSVGVTDTHDGSDPLATPGFASWSNQNGSPGATLGDNTVTLLPGAVVVFEATYTITLDDVFGGGGTGVGLTVDDDIDNSAVANATYFDGTTSNPVNSSASTAQVALNVNPSLDITKVADLDTNVPAGTLVTYTYTVTNDGTVPITNITLADTHKGVAGALVPTFGSFTTNNSNGVSYTSANTLNTIDILYPGDVAEFTATYTVTQNDVDTLQ